MFILSVTRISLIPSWLKSAITNLGCDPDLIGMVITLWLLFTVSFNSFAHFLFFLLSFLLARSYQFFYLLLHHV